MKKLIVFSALLFSGIIAFCQDLPLKFEVNQRASVKLGKEWDFSYEDMKTPMNVFFDGKVLKMTYTNGNKFTEEIVLKYEKKVKNEAGRERTHFTLQVNDNGIIQYIIIEKCTSLGGEIITTLKLPYYTEYGEFRGCK